MLLVPPAEVAERLRSVEPRWVAVVLLLHAAAIALRVSRWQLLLDEADLLIGRGGAGRWLVLDAVFLGWLINLFVPARAGDLGRPALFARRTRQGFVPVLGTVVVERGLDVAALLALLSLAVATPFVEVAWGATAAVGVGLLTAGGWLSFRRGRGGLARGALLSVSCSAVIWTLELLAVAAAFQSLGLSLGLAPAAGVVVATTLSTAVLASTAGLGIEQGASAAVLVPLGVEPGAAVALGLVIVVTADFWVIPGGLIAIRRQMIGGKL
ncbi:MAG: flippase-like domain-containing protein [Proteobacteria bacterium]|nr:flippase-like domain-containing protein [Pseudomonadota bacterium]